VDDGVGQLGEGVKGHDQGLNVMVQPRPINALYALLAAVVQVVLAALVLPWRLRLPSLVLAASMLTRMFSMDAAVSAQLKKASR